MPKYEPNGISWLCIRCGKRKSDHDSLGFCKNPLSARAQSKPADPLHEDETQEIKQILGSLSQCVQRMAAEFETINSLRDKIISLDRKISPPVYQVDMQQPSGNSPGPRPTDLGIGEKMSVRAKFYVESKTEVTGTPNNGFQISMRPVISGSDENKQFYQYTPGGKLELTTISALAASQLEVGKEYYLDFAPAE